MLDSIETDRLRLRPVAPSDRDELIALINDYEVSKWLTRVKYPYTASDFDEFLVYSGQNPLWIIEYHGAVAGCIGLVGEFGYWLGQSFWGKGIVPEAARAILSDHFKNPRAHVVYSSYFLGNEKSRAILARLGFSPIGATTQPHSLAQGQSVEAQPMVLTPEQWHFLHPPILETADLRLEISTLATVQENYEILKHKKVAWDLGTWPHPLELSDVMDRARDFRWRGAWNGNFLMRLKHSGQAVGVIGFHSPTAGRLDDMNLGYAVHPDHWGCGYATQAVNAVAAFVFDRYDCASISADFFDDNPASGRVLEKCGFKVVAHGQATGAARGFETPDTTMQLQRQQAQVAL